MSVLGKHPVIGMVAPMVGSGFWSVEHLTPIVQLIGFVIGCAVGVLTIAIKCRELKNGGKHG